MIVVILSGLLGGCAAPTTVDEACPEKLRGDKWVESVADEQILNRINCYRALSRTGSAPVQQALQDAMENHVDYWVLNAVDPYVDDIVIENPTGDGYTGPSTRDRISAAGGDAENLDWTRSEAFYTGVLFEDAGKLIDFWMYNPWARADYTHDGAWGLGGSTMTSNDEIPVVPMANTVITYPPPDNVFAAPPKVYPRDGQVDVPSSWYADPQAEYPMYTEIVPGDYGFPITVAAGLGETGLEISGVSLVAEGEDPMGLLIINPNIAFVSGLSLFEVAVVLPNEPLTVGTTYEFQANVKTNQGERKAKSTFTVGTAVRPENEWQFARRELRVSKIEPLE